MPDWIDVSDVTPSISYTVASPATVFTVPFVFFADTDLEVSVNGVPKTLATDYTVEGARDEAGGTVTFLASQNGVTVLIERALPYALSTHIPPTGPLDVPGINLQFSKIVAMIQQFVRWALPLPTIAARAGKYAAYDVNGDAVAVTPTNTAPTVISALLNNSAVAGATAADALNGLGTRTTTLEGQVVPKTSSPLYAQTLGWSLVASGENLITLGGFSVNVAYGFGSLWVERNDPPAVLRINPKTGTIIATISAGVAPTNSLIGICVSNDSVWFSDSVAGRVGRIDPATNTASFPVGLTGLGATLRGLAFDGTSIWVTVSVAAGQVKKINPATNTVTATVSVGNTPMYPCWDGANHLWVPNGGESSISRVHITNNTVTSTVSTAGTTWSAFCDGPYVYVTEIGNDSIARYGVGSSGINTRWSVAAGASLHGILVVDDQIWAVEASLNQIQVLNKYSGAIIKTFPVGTDPAGIYFDGRDIWNVDAISEKLRRHSMFTTWQGGVS